MTHCNDILYGGKFSKYRNPANIKTFKKIKVPSGKFGKVGNLGITSGGFFSISKIFFILIIICTIAYLSLQIQKSKYEKKYVVALLVLFVFGLVGGLFITKLKGPGPYALFYITKFIFLGGPLITFLVLNILLGQNKF